MNTHQTKRVRRATAETLTQSIPTVPGITMDRKTWMQICNERHTPPYTGRAAEVMAWHDLPVLSAKAPNRARLWLYAFACTLALLFYLWAFGHVHVAPHATPETSRPTMCQVEHRGCE